MNATVYSMPACTQCNATYRALTKKGLPFQKVDVTQDPEAHAFTKELGYLQAPVVVIRDENGEVQNHWGGFNDDKIEEFALAVKAA